MAIPRGPDRAGSLSGMVGTPGEFEYRTVTGLKGLCTCGARVSFAASGDGAKVPEHIIPNCVESLCFEIDCPVEPDGSLDDRPVPGQPLAPAADHPPQIGQPAERLVGHRLPDQRPE